MTKTATCCCRINGESPFSRVRRERCFVYAKHRLCRRLFVDEMDSRDSGRDSRRSRAFSRPEKLKRHRPDRGDDDPKSRLSAIKIPFGDLCNVRFSLSGGVLNDGVLMALFQFRSAMSRERDRAPRRTTFRPAGETARHFLCGGEI